MSITYGVTASGFVRPRLVDIQAQIYALMTSTFGAAINQLPSSLVSQFVGTYSEREDLIWQALEDVYNSQYPDLSFGVSLDNAAGISGAVRLGAMASTVTGQLLFGLTGTLIPAGSQISVEGAPANVFATDNDTTLIAGQNCIQTITFPSVPTSGQYALALNANVTALIQYNDTAATIQAALQATPLGAGILVTGTNGVLLTVTFAGFAGLQPQSLLTIQENTLANGGAVEPTVAQTQAGIAQGTVNLTATETGPLLGPASDVNTIVTPINGWTSTINPLDATVGRNVESDNDFKQRRNEELQIAAKSTIDAIRSNLLTVSGVTAVIMAENDTNVTDGNGLPAKSFHATVAGSATSQSIWDEILAVKPAGIQAYGTICGTSIDSEGIAHTICYDTPTPVLIYIILNISINANYPATGDALCQEALVSSGNALGIGTEVVVNPYLMASLAAIPGIETAQILIGTAPDPVTSGNVEIADNQVSVFDTSRIIVNHV